MQRRSLIYLLVAALLAIAILAWALSPDPVVVDVATVKRGAIRVTVDDDGVTQVRDRFVLTAPVAGTLLRPSVRAGDTVARDQVLAVIVPNAAQMLDLRTRSELAARVEAAAARLARAGAAARQSEFSLKQAESDRQKLDSLAREGYASTTELERASLAVDLRRKDREAALFEQDAALHDLQQARAAYQQSNVSPTANTRNAWNVRAPIAGRILSVARASEGAIPVGGEILQMADLSRLEARIDVLTGEATRIQPQAYVELEAGDGTTLKGRVRLVEPAARTRISALGVEEQRVDVIVDLLATDESSAKVGDGYRVDARIEVARDDKALLVPIAALFRDGAQWAVYRIVDGRARLIRIDIGLRGRENAAVQRGLSPGDEVVLYPGDRISEGARVRATRQDQAATD